MSFWRKLNKVIFVITLVVAIIGVIVGCVFGFIEEVWLGFMILGGGLILIPIIFSAWGIMLEFLDNVAAIRRAVCTDSVCAPMNGSVPVQVQTSAMTKAASGAYYVPNNWICSGCGKKNENDAAFCHNCGKPKD